MGLVAEYARVTRAELNQVIDDPDAGYGLLDELPGWRPGVDLATVRQIDIDKSYEPIAAGLERAGFDVDVIAGENEITVAQPWGAAPPRYLTPERVVVAARRFAALSWQECRSRVDVADPRLAEWDLNDRELAEYVEGYFALLSAFFTVAADAGDAVVIWYD